MDLDLVGHQRLARELHRLLSSAVVKFATPTCFAPALALGLAQHADGLGERHFRVGPMDEQQIDPGQLQLLQALIERALEIGGARACPDRLWWSRTRPRAQGRRRAGPDAAPPRPRSRCHSARRYRYGDSRAASAVFTASTQTASLSVMVPRPIAGILAPLASTTCICGSPQRRRTASRRKHGKQKTDGRSTALLLDLAVLSASVVSRWLSAAPRRRHRGPCR